LEKEKRFGTGMDEAATSAPGFLFLRKKTPKCFVSDVDKQFWK
jgi:hypothetical protein